jgi:hypothetical protein
MGHHGEEAILSGGSAEVGIHGGVGGSVSENDDVAGEPDGESGGDGGVGWLERVIPLCPYVPLVFVSSLSSSFLSYGPDNDSFSLNLTDLSEGHFPR